MLLNSTLAKVTCAVSGHRISKKQVWHDQLNLRANCTRCNRIMIRTIDGWRPYDPATDFHEKRLETPPWRVREPV
ncbi:MAG: hypothetical protein ABJP34_07015 [Erythrobacter sp.]